MRILITNNTLDQRAGSELYARDLALGLLDRGHTPIAYSTQLGEVAEDLRRATIPVIDNLDALGAPPDIIHGHHHLETMTALLRFPRVPAVSFCHGWKPWEETPPRFPRILRYVAVDHTCRDRLILESGIPPDRVRVLLNFVDLERFKPRGPLPVRPQRALIFSNNATDHTYAPAVREACARHGIAMDVVGLNAGNACEQPEGILMRYDLVFAKARAALESMAVGAAVVLCDSIGAGPLVTSGQFERLRLLNFGVRALRDPISADVLDRQIARYNSEDAARVSRLVRTTAGSDAIVDQLISLYREVVSENETLVPDEDGEARAASAYLRFLSPTFKAVHATVNQAVLAESDRVQLHAESEQLRNRLVEQDQTLRTLSTQAQEGQKRFESGIDLLSSRLAEKETQLARITGSFGWRLLSRYGPIKYGVLLPAWKSIVKVFKGEQAGTVDRHDSAAITHRDQDPSTPDLIPSRAPASSMEEVFEDIYRRWAWGEDCESVSGPGSSIARTSSFRDQIGVLVKDLNVRTLLDAGCGDFNWLRFVDLDLERYIGADVVAELISTNRQQYGNATRTFLQLDLTSEQLPQADLILSRDCLVHLSFKDAAAAIKNFKASGSKYLLTTTFPYFDSNADVETGGWRFLNVQASPFNFGEPLKLIEETRKTSPTGIEVVKYLGLWELKDIPLPVVSSV